MGLYRPWIERDRPLKILPGFVILVLSQENAAQLGARRGMVRMVLEEVAKHSDSLIRLSNGIIRETQIIRSSNLIGLQPEALFERGLGFGVLALEVVDRAHCVVQDGILGTLLQKPREKGCRFGQVAFSDIG